MNQIFNKKKESKKELYYLDTSVNLLVYVLEQSEILLDKKDDLNGELIKDRKSKV